MQTMSITPQVRLGALLCMAGGAGLFILAVASLGVPELALGAAPLIWLQVLLAACHVGQMAGIAAVGLSGAVGRAGVAGVWLAGAGAATFAVAELTALASRPGSETAFGVGSLLTVVGLSIAGGSVLRQGRWNGPGRFLPVVLGAYNVVMLVVLIVGPVPLAVAALALNGLLWALLGWSIRQAGSVVRPALV